MHLLSLSDREYFDILSTSIFSLHLFIVSLLLLDRVKDSKEGTYGHLSFYLVLRRAQEADNSSPLSASSCQRLSLSFSWILLYEVKIVRHIMMTERPTNYDDGEDARENDTPSQGPGQFIL